MHPTSIYFALKETLFKNEGSSNAFFLLITDYQNHTEQDLRCEFSSITIHRKGSTHLEQMAKVQWVLNFIPEIPNLMRNQRIISLTA